MARQTRALTADRERERNPSVELTDDIRRYLLYGDGPVYKYCMRIAYFPEQAEPYQQDIGAVWKVHREALIEQYRAENGGHGMPNAWWMYDCPERRRVVSGNKYLIIHNVWDEELPGNRGLPNAYRGDPEFEDNHPSGQCVRRKNPPVFESEEDYLRRLDLW